MYFPDLGVDWIRRPALYICALGLIWGGCEYYNTLAFRAAVVDFPYRQVTVFEGQLGGNNLKEGLKETGSSKAEVRMIVRALRKVGGVGRLRIGDSYRIVRSTNGAFHHLTLTRARNRVVVTKEGESFRAALSKVQLHDVVLSAQGTIKDSLWMSMTRKNAPPEIIQEFADVFQWTIDFLTEPRDGDTWGVTWVERRSPDGRRWGRVIHAAVYKGKRTKRRVGIKFGRHYYNEKGETLQRIFLRAPLNFRRISSYFSRGRWHPILRKRRPHHGIDYAAPRGTPVVTVGGGTVIAVGRSGGYGKRIEIRHNSTYKTLYGHLSRYRKGIRIGRKVKQGDVIGYVGSTGLATGPHLHFQVAKRGRWVNFLRLKLPKAKSVSVKDKDSFFRVRDRWLVGLRRNLDAGAVAAAAGNGR